jgi:hypothetical protein
MPASQPSANPGSNQTPPVNPNKDIGRGCFGYFKIGCGTFAGLFGLVIVAYTVKEIVIKTHDKNVREASKQAATPTPKPFTRAIIPLDEKFEAFPDLQILKRRLYNDPSPRQVKEGDVLFSPKEIVIISDAGKNNPDLTTAEVINQIKVSTAKDQQVVYTVAPIPCIDTAKNVPVKVWGIGEFDEKSAYMNGSNKDNPRSVYFLRFELSGDGFVVADTPKSDRDAFQVLLGPNIHFRRASNKFEGQANVPGISPKTPMGTMSPEAVAKLMNDQATILNKPQFDANITRKFKGDDLIK